jgi:hypothetical protein
VEEWGLEVRADVAKVCNSLDPKARTGCEDAGRRKGRSRTYIVLACAVDALGNRGCREPLRIVVKEGRGELHGKASKYVVPELNREL